MTILTPITRMLAGFERTDGQRSSLVLRLIKARDDPAKRRLRDYLLAQTDDRLKQSLGFTDSDIRVLRRGRI
jgi:hypothetical protein